MVVNPDFPVFIKTDWISSMVNGYYQPVFYLSPPLPPETFRELKNGTLGTRHCRGFTQANDWKRPNDSASIAMNEFAVVFGQLNIRRGRCRVYFIVSNRPCFHNRVPDEHRFDSIPSFWTHCALFSFSM